MAVKYPTGRQLDIVDITAAIAADPTSIGNVAGGLLSDPGAVAAIDGDYVRIDGTNQPAVVLVPGTPGDFAALNASGEIIDSGVQASDLATAAQGLLADSALQPGNVDNVSELINDANYAVATTVYTKGENDGTAGNAGAKIDKVAAAVAGNIAELDASGELVDSGNAVGDFLLDTTDTFVGTLTVTGDIQASGGVNALQSATTAVDVSASAAPTVGQILTAVNGSLATWQDAPTPIDAYLKLESDGAAGNAGAKINKVSGATTGNFAEHDATGQLQAGSSSASNFATAAQGTLADSALQPGGVDNVSELINDANYQGQVVPGTVGDFAALDASGNIIDGGSQASDFATAAQGTLADSALQNVVEDTTPQLGGNLDLNGFSVSGTTVQMTANTAATGGAVTLTGGNGSAGVGGIIRIRPGKSNLNASAAIEIAAATGTITAPRLRFSEAQVNGFSTVDLKAPDALAGDRTWILPAEVVSTVDGFFLTTDSSGQWSFVEVGKSAVFSVSTSDATVTPLAAIAVPVDEVVTATIRASGYETATGDTISEIIHVTARNDSTVTTIVGAPTSVHLATSGAPPWTFTVSADDAADTLLLEVTGELAHSIDWTATIEWAQG